MRIGIDFDNTIVKYDKIFINTAIKLGFINKNWNGTKKMLREVLIKKDNQWELLQGQVYGPLMLKAKPFSGVKKFLFTANLHHHKIFIISHKSIYGHFDNTKTKLREQALTWLKKENFFNKNYISLNKSNIFFCQTRTCKIKKINELKLDFMIDDLEEIFEHKLKNETKTILFNSQKNKKITDYNCENWNEISKVILTSKEIEYGLIKISNYIKPKHNFNSIYKVNKGKNSDVYILKDTQNKYDESATKTTTIG